MANTFSKEERVAFEDMVEGFDDALVLSRNVNKYNTDMKQMERSSDTIWRPVPYIATSIDGPAGTDITSSFTDVGQLSVPSSITNNKTVPWTMNALELRDALQNDRFGKAAAQKLASDVNVSVLDAITDQGTLVVTKASAASAFSDVAAIEKMMNEQGIPMRDRYLAMSTGDYNGLAGDLAGRGTLQPPKTLKAYEEAYVGSVSGFDTYKLDYSNSLTLDAMTTIVVNGANQRHVPLTQSSGANYDNREQTLAITATSGTVKVGDCITIAGVNAVHHITKVDTGVLKTFRITEIVSGGGSTGNIKISPPIIAADSSPTDIELQYKNVTAAPADTAAITPLNIATAKMNPFWFKDAIEILPGRLSIDTGAGVDVMNSVTPQGLVLTLSKQWAIGSNKMFFRLDCLWGVTVLNPEMCGIALFSQT